MSYVNSGYAVGLSAMFLYAVSLMLRRRRLERRTQLPEADRDGVEGQTPAGNR